MKKFRSLMLICVLVFAMLSLAGCQAVPVPEGSPDRATLVIDEQYVKVYSPVASTIDLEVTVQYDGKEATLVKQIRVANQGTETITVQNLGEDLFNGNAKIINATIIKQTDVENEPVIFIAVIFVVIIIVGGIATVSTKKR